MKDILDLHTHTIASGHAYNTLYEMAQAAADKGLAVYGCSEHAPSMPGTCHEFYFTNFKVLPRVIRGVPVLMGAELNILDFEGHVDLDEYYLKRSDYAVASLHTPMHRQQWFCCRLHKSLSECTGKSLCKHYRTPG